MIREIETLGKKIDRLWRKRKGKNSFSSIAFKALKEFRPRRQFSLKKFLGDFWKVRKLPRQLGAGDFGQPPITIYRSKKFVIDLYFWLTPDTAIHSHLFEGAFAVLQGRSLHCTYDFSDRKGFSGRRMRVGNLRLKEMAMLRPGDVVEILFGPEWIHQVWHLGFPSVSLAVRTFRRRQPRGKGPRQFQYLKPNLGMESRANFTTVRLKQIAVLGTLHRTRPNLAESSLRSLLMKCGPEEGLLVLNEFFNKTGDASLAARAVKKIPQLAPFVSPFLNHLKTNPFLDFNWMKIRGEGERFFLALLYSRRGREEIKGLIRRYFPGKTAEQWMAEWCRRLVKKGELEFGLNETGLTILTALIRGQNENKIYRQFSRRYRLKNSESVLKDIRSFTRKLRNHDFFGALVLNP